MKKTYIHPQMEIVKITSKSLMLAGSPGIGGSYSGGDILSREEDFDNFDE